MKNKFCIGLFLVFLSGLLAYVNILNNNFVFDDSSTIENNKIIRNLRNLPVLFTHDYFKRAGIGDFTLSGEASYRPVVTLSYFIDFFIWKENSYGFHLTNLLLHLLNILVFYSFLNIFLRNNTVSLISGILFSVTPVVSEAVNCISFREDILCSLFFVSGLFFHFNNKYRYKNYIVCLFYFLSLFSKEMGIVFFPILILLDIYENKYRNNSNVSINRNEYLLLAVVTLFYISIRFYFMKNFSDKELDYLGGNIFLNALIMAQIFMYYIKIMLYPIQLCVDYITDIPQTFFSLKIIFSAICILLLLYISIVYGIIKKTDKNKYFLFILIFFVSLVPVSNIIPIKNVIAERYLYLPYGFFAVAYTLLFFKSDQYKKYKIICFIVIMVLYLSITLKRNEVWNNSYTLWSNTLKANPESFHAHNNLASFYDDEKKYNKSEYHYKMAIKLRPYDPIPYYNLGNTYKAQGKIKEAILLYNESINRDPTIIEPYINMGIVYASSKMLDQAEQAFRKAIRVNEFDSSAHNNLAAVLGEKGNLDEAIKEHIIAIKLDRKNLNAYFNLGLCYMDKHNYSKAINIFNKLIKIDPEYYNAYYYIGKCYEFIGNESLSVKYIQKFQNLTRE